MFLFSSLTKQLQTSSTTSYLPQLQISLINESYINLANVLNLYIETLNHGTDLDKKEIDKLQLISLDLQEEQNFAKLHSKVLNFIYYLNIEQFVFNKHFLLSTKASSHKSHRLPADTLVIVVQVHNRFKYLKTLVQSLEKINHIDRVLLIFSHDVIDDQINSLIQNITFCTVSL